MDATILVNYLGGATHILSKTKHNVMIGAIFFIAIIFMTTQQAKARVIPLSMCDRVYDKAPAGNKWKAKQECLNRIKEHNLNQLCKNDRPLLSALATVKGSKVSTHQRKVITTVLNNGRRRKMSKKIMISAVATLTQEQTAHNLPYGHGTSVGGFQLISIHGSVEWRMNLMNSSNWYYNGAIQKDRPYLSIGELAQKVQGSAYPEAYKQWVNESRKTYKLFLGPCPS